MNFCVIRRLFARGRPTFFLEEAVDPISFLVFGNRVGLLVSQLHIFSRFD